MSDQNKESQEEQRRVNFVLNEIEKQQAQLKNKVGDVKEGIISLRKNFWDDVTVNLDEPDDIIETQASIKQQAELLSERERSHGRMYEQLKTLGRLHDSPYFGRIDFLEGDEKESEPIYIGVASLMDENEEDFLIYDWRAPISSMYYDYAPGPAEYETIEGPIQGEITLKRQFIIRNGAIRGQFDTGLTIGDHLLQTMLGDHSSTQMKSIVATIQKEQNQIIRNQKSKLLIVQGVAGSGKTSAALQRVAYLLYANRETLSAENMLLFSPNPLFNSYVATVLPELGEENMRQTTYNEYIEERLGEHFRIEDPFEQMETFLTNGTEKSDSIRLESVQYKASLAFKGLIDNYLESLADEGLIFNDITFRDSVLISADKIKRYFYDMRSSISIPNRLELTSEWLLGKLEKHEHFERHQDWVTEEIELLDKEDYMDAYHETQRNHRFENESFDDIDQEWEILSEKVVKEHFQPLKDRIERLDFINIKENYRQMYESGLEGPNHWGDICDMSIEKLNQNELNWEEITPYLYFQDQLQGRKSYTHIKHVFIDEAQDYSPFQFAYLKQLFPNCKMTLLGDVNQAIYAHALTSNSVLSDKKAGTEAQERIELMRSYRSTQPIVKFTRQLIEGGELIKPFNRDGDKPTLTQVEHEEELHEKILARIHEMQSEGHQTIAVICKTMAESRMAYEQLKSEVPIQLLDQETYTFKKGLLVIPSYLAKGIEFDGVIIYNASQETYSKESERNLFYTACTRAMHELHLFTLGEKSPFFSGVSSDSYIYHL
ncbi:MAG TPA: RNA polymerase recycling motor HelD [Bacillales bacterium]|nr:RNA polymerase recycling motor HelD [Bacillales bacterium]